MGERELWGEMKDRNMKDSVWARETEDGKVWKTESSKRPPASAKALCSDEGTAVVHP